MDPKTLKAWLFQQRESLAAFLCPSGRRDGCQHITDILPEACGEYIGHGELHEAFMDEWHSRPSLLRLMEFRSPHGQEWSVPFPFPRDDGFFIIDGREHYAPVQRLLLSFPDGSRSVEYRRLDHCLIDAWKRKHWGWAKDKGSRTLAALASQPDRRHVILGLHQLAGSLQISPIDWRAIESLEAAGAVLAFYLMLVLRPSSIRIGSDPILQPVTGGGWSHLARLTDVKTYKARLRHDGTYVFVRAAKGGRTSERSPELGLDRYHTPEGDLIGLTRHLTVGTTISEDRKLCVMEGQESVGAFARTVPFLHNSDPRRVLMACNMLAQACALDCAEPPKVRTDFEERLHDTLPEALVPNVGVNLRVGFAMWKGYNYEDAIVVSESAAKKLACTEVRRASVAIPAYLDFDVGSDGQFDRGIRPPGSEVAEGELLVRLVCDFRRLGLDVSSSPPADRKRPMQAAEARIPWRHYSLESPTGGRILSAKRVDLYADPFCPSSQRFRARVDFEIEMRRPLQIGDKLCNRHGNKGVVSKILPDARMPSWNGIPLDILFNPIGLLNRGNYGQVYEAIYGAYAIADTQTRIGISECMANPLAHLERVCELAGLEKDGTAIVTIDDDKGHRQIRCLVGVNYILRLPYHAADKLNVHASGRYSRLTGQPPRGVAQAFGEMEIWALQAHAASAILGELCNDGIGLRDRACSSQTECLPNRDHPGATSDVQPSDAAMAHPDRPLPRHPARVISDYLTALGCELRTCDNCLQIRRLPNDTPPTGIDLFDSTIECAGDPLCKPLRKTPEQKAAAVLPTLRVLERRLNSVPFDSMARTHGILFIDLGQHVRVECRIPRRGKQTKSPTFTFEGRYLNVLPLDLRWPPSPGVLDQLTDAYRQLARALWSFRKRGSTVTVPLGPVPHNICDQITFDGLQCDGRKGLLSFTGVVTADIRRRLLELNDNREYRKAVWRLFQKSRPQDWQSRIGRIIEMLLRRLDGKQGIVRSAGLARRLEFSGRMVIVPDPRLRLDEVSLPWQAIHELFGDKLDGLALSLGQLATEHRADMIDQSLAEERVLLNRNPSLHRYSILAFRPRVHFDSRAMRLCPYLTTPFGADFDGDTMTVVRLRRPESIKESERLLPSNNLLSSADGEPLLPPVKEFRLGVALVLSDDHRREDLNGALFSLGLPCFSETPLATAIESWSSYLTFNVGRIAQCAEEFYAKMTEHAMAALEDQRDHSMIGAPAEMLSRWSAYLESGAAKNLLGPGGDGKDDALVSTGLPGREVDRRLGIMIAAQEAKGQFGGLLRRYYYRLSFPRGSEGPGRAEDTFREGLIAAQAITALATQRSLSPKSGQGALKIRDFLRRIAAIQAALRKADESQLSHEISLLAEELGMKGPRAQEVLRRHLSLLPSLADRKRPARPSSGRPTALTQDRRASNNEDTFSPLLFLYSAARGLAGLGLEGLSLPPADPRTHVLFAPVEY